MMKSKKLKLEKLIEDYPNITIDISNLIEFSFHDIKTFFEQKIKPLESDYYILINPKSSLLNSNPLLNIENNILNEIVETCFTIKSQHSSSSIKIFSYGKYVKELSEINKEKKSNTIIELIVKEIGNDTIKTDIISSLSSLYSKIKENVSSKKNNYKNKVLKIIIINNEPGYSKDITEKEYSDVDLQNGINEFLNENICYFACEIKFIDERILEKKNELYLSNIYESLTDFNIKSYDNSNKNELFKSILKSDEFLKKSEILSSNLFNIWSDLKKNESFKECLKRLDEVTNFFAGVINSLIYIENRVREIKSSNRKKVFKDKIIKEKISSELLEQQKNNIISKQKLTKIINDVNDYQSKIESINCDELYNEIKNNNNIKDCDCWKTINDYLTNQKNIISKFIEIITKSNVYFTLIGEKILKIQNNILSNTDNNDIDEDNEEEEDETEEEKED